MHVFVAERGSSVRLVQLLALAGLATASLNFSATAADTSPINIGRTAIASERSAALERTATIDGTQYAVIAPIFNEQNTGNYSFLRFINVISTSSTFTVKVVGSPSGNVYGTTTIAVPAGAAVHKQLLDILTATNATTLTGGDTEYALYISNPDLSGYQHVIYNYVSKFFENASLCRTSLSQASVQYLPNVHTKIISDAGFPSKIYLHNYANQAVTYNVSVYESSAGSLIGTVPITMQANSTTSKDFSYFETQLNWTPTGTQGYANLIITPGTAISGVTLPPVTVGHFIYNQNFQAFVNMSDTCAVNPGSASTGNSATAAKTTYAGTIAAVGGGSGTLTVNIPTSSSTASAPVTTATMTGKVLAERTQATVTATGTLVIGSTTTSLTGTYDTVTKAVSLGGGGYNFSGNVSSGSFDGSYTGPSGASGSFATLNTTQTLVTAYCGTFRQTKGGTNTGTFNLQVSLKGTISGSYSGMDGAGRISATATGSTFTGTSTGGDTVTGNISGTSVSGTYADGEGSEGTFAGSKCTLPTA
jgi:hypothetical protein